MTSYDYGSVMHYESNAFAINSNIPVIVPTQNSSAYIGQRIQLSPIDILEIQRYYGCVATPTTTVTTRTTATTTTATTATTATTISTARTRNSACQIQFGHLFFILLAFHFYCSFDSMSHFS